MLQVTAEQGDITAWDGDLIVVNLFEDVEHPGGATGAVDKALGGRITKVIQGGDLTGKLGQTRLIYDDGTDLPADRVLVVGLGEKESFDLDAVRRATGKAVKAIEGTQAETAATIVHGGGVGGLDPGKAARAIAEAAVSVTYAFERKAKTEDDEDDEEGSLSALTILEADEDKLSVIQAGVEHGNTVANAQAIARDIASFSGVEGTATNIANLVAKTAEDVGLTCTILGPEGIADEGMGGLQAVNQGSEEEARFVILEHDPGHADTTVCVVGKGVTFDTGGISIKRSKGMADMRYDKGGAAATIGVLVAAAALDLGVRVIGLTPLTDNMPSGKALKPGDIITMRSGRTVEVMNTDAEGRLILADALDHAKQYDPDHTIDMATLTGSVSVALGTQAIGMMTEDDGLAQALEAAAETSHERVWRLPFYEEYESQLDSDIADCQNVGGRKAGAITAGKFLAQFAPDGWAHLDIAGVAWNKDKPWYNADYYPKGATGAGVRLLTSWLEAL